MSRPSKRYPEEMKGSESVTFRIRNRLKKLQETAQQGFHNNAGGQLHETNLRRQLPVHRQYTAGET
ncbi:hypothetical cytosolic protein [Syntrophus aciditrophicus SB]|uniref:Hypothetical cytosolic protein n=1 Tax=Syntrophus aciditrophicus (strain SB) TaxID=56780 RepID=Q2LWA3_SYNAS|nr:hypothetical cytosolic protein [Syntrophus aciditrophicus SB]